MDILVTESANGVARTAVEQLDAAGHRIHRCRADGSRAFLCVGLTSECPIDAGTVDLVVTVRDHVRTNPAASEDGVTCALRHRVPVAVAGQTLMNPFEPFGAEAVEGDLVAECERIAHSPRPAHEAAALEVIRDTLTVEGYPTAPSAVAVRRVDGRLRVRISLPVAVAQRAREIIAVRVVGRLRDFDAHADGIDVAVETAGVGA